MSWFRALIVTAVAPALAMLIAFAARRETPNRDGGLVCIKQLEGDLRCCPVASNIDVHTYDGRDWVSLMVRAWTACYVLGSFTYVSAEQLWKLRNYHTRHVPYQAAMIRPIPCVPPVTRKVFPVPASTTEEVVGRETNQTARGGT